MHVVLQAEQYGWRHACQACGANCAKGEGRHACSVLSMLRSLDDPYEQYDFRCMQTHLNTAPVSTL